ncbi:MAG: glycoside hydrolase family 2 protein [Pseudobutyrivibrio sp.]|nr:glycoside hydrolase family 2 protein [Pseudobutyrivibrio sp.]
MAQRIYLDRKWRFFKEFSEELTSELSDRGQVVDLPHTVETTPYSSFDESIYQKVCCYQKMIYAPNQWKDQVINLTFEGVAHYFQVYINGNLVGDHACGYTAYTIDISDSLVYGKENLISVKVDSNETLNQPPFGFVIDYMTYGGIYRDVYFEIQNRARIKDIYFQPNLLERISTNKRSTKQIMAMKPQGILKSSCHFSEEVFDLAFEEKAFIRQYMDDQLLFSQPVSGLEKEEGGYILSLSSAPTPVKLWDILSPSLYTIKTELLIDDQVVDSRIDTIGFRTSEFTKNGYYLNGRKVKIRGLNRHQSYAYVGYAMPESMQRQDAKILKEELGLNGVRTSHYPQSQYFIDECDRQGLLVFTEIPGWQHIGDEKWQDQALDNVADMILQYRNHPSIILWGVRINESQDNDEFYKRTNELAHKLDKTRPTGGVRANKKSSLLEDVYTYNDFIHSGDNEGCDKKENVTSDMEKPYLITEYNGHMYPTKPFDDEIHRQNHLLRHAKVLDSVSEQADIAGSFGWCMFDYNTHKDFGSGDRICYHGVMDMFRNPKLAASVYSVYSEVDTELTVTSSFDVGEHPASVRGESYILTNADSVKMYKNGTLLKEYFPGDSPYKNLPHGPILIDDYIGEELTKNENLSERTGKIVSLILNQVALKGYMMRPELLLKALYLRVFCNIDMKKATAWYNKYVGDWGAESREYKFSAIKDGKVVKSITKSDSKECFINTRISHTLLTEWHTYDVAQVRISIVDQNDNRLYYYNEPIRFKVDGPIEIIGPDVVSPIGGATGLYIKSKGKDGDGTITIQSGSCPDVIIPVSVECLLER